MDPLAAGGLSAFPLGIRLTDFGWLVGTDEFNAVLVGIVSSTEYRAYLGLGASVGSNIANIGLVLGISALVRPLAVGRDTLRRHVPFMVGAAVLLVALGFDGTLSRLDGGILLFGLVVFTATLLRSVRDDSGGIDGANEDDGVDGVADEGSVATDGGVVTRWHPRNALYLILVLVGLGLLLVGSRKLIDNGSSLLFVMGAGDRLVGLTILALGTSLPELATSVVSAVRGEADFSVDNVVGSNVYNVLAVAGVVALTSGFSIPPVTRVTDFGAMLVFTAAAVAVMLRGRRITRLNGVTLVVGYVALAYFFF